MKKCLTYMSRFWGWDKYLTTIACFILFPIMGMNALLILFITYIFNTMSLSIYGTGGAVFEMGGHDKLTFSLPMSRKTVYDTRMYFAGLMYLICIVLSMIPRIHKRLDFYYLCSIALFLFGHIICGICIRKPQLQIISGMPAFIAIVIAVMSVWSDPLNSVLYKLESTNVSVLVFGIICIITLVIDVFVWIRERRIFIYGSPKGNAIRKEKRRKDDKYYGPEKKKLPGILYILIPFGALVVIGYLLLPLLAIGIFALGYKTAKVEVHDNVNDYLKYHTGEQAEDAYQNKWDMDETIWPVSITKDMDVDEYKMVYYDPWDKQFLGYLTVRYDKENYEKEVKRLKDYQSTEYLGYYGVTGFEDYELLAMYADSYQGFVYALTDGEDKIIYVEIIFCNYYMDLDYEKYIPKDYLPEGFDANMDNPYQKKWEKENGLDKWKLN